MHKFNRENCKWILENTDENSTDKHYYNFVALNNEEIIGGAIGYDSYGWYFLDELWISEKYRKIGIGTKIINEIEKYAKENNLLGVRTESWSFQAKGFYEKMGYKVYATFEDCPPGTIDYFLRKKF